MIVKAEHCKDGEHYNLIKLRIEGNTGIVEFYLEKEEAERLFESLDEALCEWDGSA